MKTVFKQILADFYENPLKDVKRRDLTIPLNSGKIISIIWPRRAGKSYFLHSIINALVASWTPKTDIIYINFEDERIDISWEKLQVLIDAYIELYNDKNLQEVYFFFDEIQNIPHWEKFVRRIYEDGMKNIFITGSNAKLLSKEIATSLRGRSLSFELLPLSFKEFLAFKWILINEHSTKGKATVLSLQKEYLIRWGFPEILNFPEDLKVKTLQEYFDVMLYNDIIERYKVKDTMVLKHFIKQLIQTTTKEYSINKIGNTLQSMGLKFDKNILYSFLDYGDTIYFWKSVSKYDFALIKQTLKKWYMFDNGFLNAISFDFSDNFWKLLENMVFVELYRRFWEHIFFLKNGSETDFVVDRKEKHIFQICYDLNTQNREREIKGCLDAMEKFSLKESFLITFAQEEEIQIKWTIIRVLPFWKMV